MNCWTLFANISLYFPKNKPYNLLSYPLQINYVHSSNYNPTAQQVRSTNNAGISDIDAKGGEGNVYDDDTEESLNSPHVIQHRRQPRYDSDNDDDYSTPSIRLHRRRPVSRFSNNFNPTIQQVTSVNNKGIEHIEADGGSGNVFHSHKHQDLNSPHFETAPQPRQPIPYVPRHIERDEGCLNPAGDQYNDDNATGGEYGDASNDNVGENGEGPHSFVSL